MRNLLITAAMLGVSLSLPARAEDQETNTAPNPEGYSKLEEVVVTAERRVSDVQKTATSVSERSGDDMLQQGRTSLSQILEDVPGLSISPATNAITNGPSDNSGNQYVIRGVITDTSGGTNVPTTAVYTDGVYGGIGGDYDIARVEVLRGPQGTLYGRSATGGVVATYTHDPELGEFGGYAQAEYGSYDLKHTQSAVNIPLLDTLALRVAGSYFTQNGTASADGGWHDLGEGRAKLLWHPTENSSVLLGYAADEQHVHSGGLNPILSAPDTFTYQSESVSPGVSREHQVWGKFDYDFGPATLTYEPAYRTFYTETKSVLGPGSGIINNLLVEPTDFFLSHEVHLTSNASTGIKWIVGSIYYDNDFRQATTTNWIASGALLFTSPNHKITHDVGVFGEATWPLGAALRLTTGLRFDYTSIENDEVWTQNTNTTGVPFSSSAGLPEQLTSLSLSGDAATHTFRNVVYKVRLEKDLTAENLLYVMNSTSFLPGDVQVATGAGNQPIPIDFSQERLNAFEIGSKNRFLDDRLQINGAAFYYLYAGYQQSTNLNSGISAIPDYVVLTSPAHMYGLELEATYLLTKRDRFDLNVSYTYARFVDQSALFRSYVAQTRIPDVVPASLMAIYEHSFRLGNGSEIRARLDGRLTSGYDLTALTQATLAASPEAHVGTTLVGDFVTTWMSPSGNYSVSGYIRNFGNRVFPTFASVQTATTGFQVDGTPSTPRVFGIMGRVGF